ncbi:MAG: glycosyltransferase family 4 protein [Actinobacteria bacterium]|nr:glycosyltransferase family 4 protein [Actinomycetota bacterium]MBW3649602.1 glycosyltransferase family 4 protein [Actinomycetota bacterium]
MKIFHVCADRGVPLDGTKGASVHMRGLAAALVSGGHEVVGFTSAVPRPEPDSPVYPAPLHIIDSPHSIIRAACSTGTPDIVYERYSLGHRAGLVAARRLGRPFVLEVNAPLVVEARRHRPASVGPGDADLERTLFREADLVVAVSEPLRRHVAAVRGSDEGTVVVTNGCDPALHPVPARLDAAPEATLVFLGHPKPWHGAEQLPPVVALLRRRGRKVRLLVIGGGKGAEAMRRAAHRAGVAPWLEVTGPLVPALAAARLVEASIAVAPYPADPFFYFCPLKVIECMAAGLPVVTTDQGDLGAIVGDGGVLVAPGQTKALVAAIEDLLDDGPRRRRIGSLARDRALSRFTWEAAAQSLVSAVGRLGVGEAA